MAANAIQRDENMKDGEHVTGFDEKKVPGYISRVENLQEQIDDIMAQAREKCAPLREDIDAVKKEAHEHANIPRQVLNTKISERRLRRQADAKRDKLTAEQQEDFDRMSHALGELKDTPLGAAALKGAKPKSTEGATAH